MPAGWCGDLDSRCEDSTGAEGIRLGDWGWVFVFMGVGVWLDVSSLISRPVSAVPGAYAFSGDRGLAGGFAARASMSASAGSGQACHSWLTNPANFWERRLQAARGRCSRMATRRPW